MVFKLSILGCKKCIFVAVLCCAVYCYCVLMWLVMMLWMVDLDEMNDYEECVRIWRLWGDLWCMWSYFELGCADVLEVSWWRYDDVMLTCIVYCMFLMTSQLVIAQLVERWTVVCNNSMNPSVAGSIPARESMILFAKIIHFNNNFTLFTNAKSPSFSTTHIQALVHQTISRTSYKSPSPIEYCIFTCGFSQATVPLTHVKLT